MTKISDEKKSMNTNEVEGSVPENASSTDSENKEETPSASAQLSADAEMKEEAADQPAAYSMRPAFGESFPIPIVKNIINSTMAAKLKGMLICNPTNKRC